MTKIQNIIRQYQVDMTLGYFKKGAETWGTPNTMGTYANSFELSTRLFPNPSNGPIFLSTNLNLPITYDIINITGHHLQTGQILANQTEILVKEKGVFTLRLISKDGLLVNKKIVIE